MIIKNISFFFFLLLFSSLLCSCDSQFFDSSESYEANVLYCKMEFDAMCPSFCSETDTRANNVRWKDGDKVYIYINSETYGVGLYRAGEWEFSYNGHLRNISNAYCSVYYIQSDSQSNIEDALTLNAFNAVYGATHAIYSYSAGELLVSAILNPLSSRMRFKGHPNTEISLTSSSLKYFKKLDITNNQISFFSDIIHLTVDDDGFTDYIYVLSEEDTRISIDTESFHFSDKVIEKSLFNPGASGVISIPSYLSHDGWNMQSGNAGRCIVVTASEMVEVPWDNQFWIVANEPFAAGDTWEICFNMRADHAASIGTQIHGKEPGSYKHWDAIGSVSFGTDWETYQISGSIPVQGAGGQSIAFNLNDYTGSNNYCFSKISLKVNGVEQVNNPYFLSNDVSSFYQKIDRGNVEHCNIIDGKSWKNILEGSNGRKWSWANDGGLLWGNAGNTGNGSGYSQQVIDGLWWGVDDATDLTGQIVHAGGIITGDESNDAYMLFKDGTVTAYDANDNEIRHGSYEINIYPDGRHDGWELGKLTTTEPALLFPWSVNEGGKAVTEFDIMYIDDYYMILVNTKGTSLASWSEITFWRFKVK